MGIFFGGQKILVHGIFFLGGKVVIRCRYLFILVCGDGDELGFLEDVGSEGAVGQLEDVVGPDQVEPRLVLVHRVQDRLQQSRKYPGNARHTNQDNFQAVSARLPSHCDGQLGFRQFHFTLSRQSSTLN